MPPPLLIDLQQVDLSRVLLTREQLYEQLPHRFEFMLLDGVCMLDREATRLVAYADIRPDDWWIRGHVPDRPLLPGVLMLEMAAQASAVAAKVLTGNEAFIGLGSVEDCKFRETVSPPARLYLLCVGDDYRTRRIVSRTQGVIDGRLIFEARITGLALR
ncbi:MAG: beta-hydroxyacyl-ACP dehydratase [Phycisphaerales bacterium]|nr:MAG: beta-hydroxyacyl-ACP dehydratase [Phycisphaerales bacterium]